MLEFEWFLVALGDALLFEIFFEVRCLIGRQHNKERLLKHDRALFPIRILEKRLYFLHCLHSVLNWHLEVNQNQTDRFDLLSPILYNTVHGLSD